MLKTALKTVFYAEEYHLFLVTDIYFDIFCIDCIVKSAETQTCIVYNSAQNLYIEIKYRAAARLF